MAPVLDATLGAAPVGSEGVEADSGEEKRAGAGAEESEAGREFAESVSASRPAGTTSDERREPEAAGGTSEGEPVMIMDVGREGPEMDAREPDENDARRPEPWDERRMAGAFSPGGARVGRERVFEIEPHARWGT